MITLAQYASWFEALGFNTVSFGYSGITLFAPGELDKQQIGYSRGADGQSFCDGRLGSWQPQWLVIGQDTLVGDPFIVDTSHPSSRVMTAMHGEGPWNPYQIARSLDVFGETLRTIRQIAVGREYPVALEKNPLPEAERDKVLDEINRLNGGAIEMDFWKIFLGMEA